MKPVPAFQIRRDARGFTLLEISLVIGLMLGLSAFIGFGYNAVSDYKRGKDASLSLQAVYAAQRAYMADNPTGNIAAVSQTQLQAYLPQGWSTMPTFAGLKGESLTLNFSVMPPILLNGISNYDPSPKTSDGLWDVGE